MHEAIDDKRVTKIIAMKSAQVAWTDGVLLNYIGKRMHLDPCAMIVMFPKMEAGANFNRTKLIPMIEATPALNQIIDLNRRNSPDNTSTYKGFPGGSIRLVGSNAAVNVKSDPAPVVCVEEPDDCNANISGQGDSITLLEERTKTFMHRKVIMGGTPTVDGVSRVQSEFRLSDQRKFWVPCPHCGERQVLEWENVHWEENAKHRHEIYGNADPETAHYVCPHCGGVWTEAEKNRAVKQGEWKASAPFNGIAGFYINEIYSPFPGSTLPRMAEKYLNAKKHLDMGDDSVMRSFFNNQLGKPYRYTSDLPEANELAQRVEPYPQMVLPRGAYIVTAGVDVQHDRVAIIVRAWGREMESWLLYWGEIYGQVMVPEKGVWPELDAFLTQEIPAAAGNPVKISAVSIDSSDGQTSDAVYTFVRKRMNKGIRAIKGSSIDTREIDTIPGGVDFIHKSKQYKKDKRGVVVWQVGVSKAKDLILGTTEQTGMIKRTTGAMAMHWYEGVREDYFDQLLSEIKVPSSTKRGKLVWQKLAGERNEALDCEVYALHAARTLKLHTWSPSKWDAVETESLQQGLFKTTTEEKPEAEKATTEQQIKTPKPQLWRNQGGFRASVW